jgi:hypothetical protein
VSAIPQPEYALLEEMKLRAIQSPPSIKARSASKGH